MSEPAPSHDTRAERQFERLSFFSDAVFAIAITLLVLDLKPPPGAVFIFDLREMGGGLEGFGISFFVIAVYWLAHHDLFGRLRREDGRLRVANLIFLASIAFLPFPTSVIARFPATTASVIFYALSVAAVGLAQFALTLAARRPALMRLEESAAETPIMLIRTLITPAIFLASVVVAIFSPSLATLSWILIWPAIRALDWTRRIWRRSSAAIKG